MSTPSLVLVQGPEAVLADRALEQVVADVRVTSPEVEVVTLRAEGYEEGELGVHASPSLFGEDKLIIVRDLHQAPDALQLDLLGYLADPADEFELSEDEDDDLSSVEVQLTLSVTPGRGKPFTAQLSQRYATVDALRLERGQHGPVRYLLRSPETTAAVDASLSPDAVQRLYRAAALNG